MRAPLSYMTRYSRGLLPRVPRLLFRLTNKPDAFGNSLISSRPDSHETSLEEPRGKLAALKEEAMQRRPWAHVTATGAAIVLAIAVFGFALPYATPGIDAATPTPQAQTEATATPTPRPTRTPAPTATPVPVLTPLPSLDDLRYYTPVAEAPTEAPAPAEAPSATPVPPRAPAQNQPPRAPVRATQTEPAPTAKPEPPAPLPVLEPVAEPTLKARGPLAGGYDALDPSTACPCLERPATHRPHARRRRWWWPRHHASPHRKQHPDRLRHRPAGGRRQLGLLLPPAGARLGSIARPKSVPHCSGAQFIAPRLRTSHARPPHSSVIPSRDGIQPSSEVRRDRGASNRPCPSKIPRSSKTGRCLRKDGLLRTRNMRGLNHVPVCLLPPTAGNPSGSGGRRL